MKTEARIQSVVMFIVLTIAVVIGAIFPNPWVFIYALGGACIVSSLSLAFIVIRSEIRRLHKDDEERSTNEAERLAKRFHETYERLAPQYNYKTRKESAVPWDEVPESNKSLMIAVCKELIERKNQ